jgi:hypothetical protein
MTMPVQLLRQLLIESDFRKGFTKATALDITVNRPF